MSDDNAAAAAASASASLSRWRFASLIVAMCVRLCVLSRPADSVPFGVSRFLQANIFRTNAVYVATIVLAAVVGTGAYDAAFQFAWETNNKGVSHHAHTMNRRRRRRISGRMG